MSDDQAERIMLQIPEMYLAYGRGVSYSSDDMALLINGLFETAKEIEPKRMDAAFSGRRSFSV